MNARVLSVLLVLTSLGLGAWLFLSHRQADAERQRLEAGLVAQSNQLVDVNLRLDEQRKVNASLETNLAQRIQENGLYSNKLTLVNAEFARLEAESKAAQEQARVELEKREKQIASLESEKGDLSKQMGDLGHQITSLEGRIQDTQRKLSAAEGNREFLQGELRRLMAEKADLERRLNDLAFLRDQVKRLKEELSVARRIEFIRKGLYGSDRKGAQLLQEGVRRPAAPTVDGSLNVEVHPDGRAIVQPPPQP